MTDPNRQEADKKREEPAGEKEVSAKEEKKSSSASGKESNGPIKGGGESLPSKTTPEKPAKKEERAAAMAKAAARAKAWATDMKKPPPAKRAEEPPEPSPRQPLLDRYVAMLTERVGPEAVEDSFINRRDGDRPTLVISPEKWAEAARLLCREPSLGFHYLENLSGVDYETRMEVVYHLTSLTHGQDLCVKVKTGREDPQVPSVTGVWRAADWHEREVYDLLGIRFTNHPNLSRILLPDDWVGHPLRKDYEPYDQGV